MARGEVEQQPPLVSALRRLSLGTERHRRELAKVLGIGSSELAVLHFLDESGTLTPRDIGERLGITTGSTTAVLDRVEAAGYLRRAPNPNDRRSLLLSLTDSGAKAMAWARSAQQQQLAEACAAAPVDVAVLGAWLETAVQALNEPLRAAPPAAARRSARRS